MTTITLPGLVDVHVHLRVPGGEHKEDFYTGTRAALAGGITTVLAMPNTSPPLTTADTLAEARRQAAQAIVCDVGIYGGASAADRDKLPQLAPAAAALKIYLNDTYGKLRVDDLPTLRACFKLWPTDKLIAMHAEKQSVAVGIALAATYRRPVHLCHISRRQEIELIADAKMAGLPVTCEVAPHHLFLDHHAVSRLNTLGDMRPVLGTPDDVTALWQHINDTVDCIATDHAPHTLAEKMSDDPPPGVPGLETSLSLMLTAVDQNKLALDRLIQLMHHNPKKIFNLPDQPETHVDVLLEPYTVDNETLETKCGWSPFAGDKLLGRVQRVTLRGQTVYENGEVVVPAGTGRLIPENGSTNNGSAI